MEASDHVDVVTTATANSFDSTIENGDGDVRSYQETSGLVTARSEVSISDQAGGAAVVNTAATGNTGDTNVFGGVMTAVATQVTGPERISAYSEVNAADAGGYDAASSTQAVGNSHGIGFSAASTGALVTQRNAATIDAEGHAFQGWVENEAVYSSTATGDNITVVGADGSAARVVASQVNATDFVQGHQEATLGYGYLATVNGTATGNNLAATSEGGLLDVSAYQESGSYIGAEAYLDAGSFGAGSAVAYGVGNSMMAGTIGPELVLSNTQVNSGEGVLAMSAFTGGDGYDAQASSTAIGNAATGYVCNECGGRMVVTNSQANSAGVGATARTTVTGPARTVTGVATAIGNTASYYVTSTSGGQ